MLSTKIKKTILTITLMVLFYAVKSQVPPGLPSPSSTGYAKYGYLQTDSAGIAAKRDTLWNPSKIGSWVYWQHAGVDSAFWVFNGRATGKKWDKVVVVSGSTSPGTGTVTIVSTTDTYAFSSIVSNPTTIPNITSVIDTTKMATRAYVGTSVVAIVYDSNYWYKINPATVGLKVATNINVLGSVTAASHITQGGTSAQVTLGDGTLGPYSSIQIFTQTGTSGLITPTGAGSPISTTGTIAASIIRTDSINSPSGNLSVANNITVSNIYNYLLRKSTGGVVNLGSLSNDSLQVGQITTPSILGGSVVKVRVGSHYIDFPSLIDGTVALTSQINAGTVTNVSVVTANGISGTVANPATTPAITLVLGNITPSSINSSGAITATTFNGSGRALTGVLTSVNTGVGISVSTNGGVFTITNSSPSSGGTVTQFTVTGANGIGVSGSPITSTGTIALSLGNITPTTVSASGGITATFFVGDGRSLGGVVKYTDTASMLSNLLRKTDTVNMLSNLLRKTDTATAFSGYVRTIGVLSTNGVSGTSSGGQNPLLTISVSGSALTGVVTSVQAGSGISVLSNGGVFTVTNSATSAVSSVSGTDNKITVSPTTGAVVVTLPTNVIVAGTISATGLISTGQITAVGLNGTITTPSQTNITSLGTLTGLSVVGLSYHTLDYASQQYTLQKDPVAGFSAYYGIQTAIGSGAINIWNWGLTGALASTNTGGKLSLNRYDFSGASVGQSIIFNEDLTTTFGGAIAATLSTAAQPNITSLGTLIILTVTGNIKGSGLTLSGSAIAATATFTAINGLNLSGGAATGKDINVGVATMNYSDALGNGICVNETTGANSSNLVIFRTTATATIGSITTGPAHATVVYNVTSDKRLKTNFLKVHNALSTLNKIEIVSFDWKKSLYHEPFGLTAQQLYTVYPNAVTKPKKESDVWMVDKSSMVPLIIGAVQEQQKTINTQNNIIKLLEARISALEKLIIK